MTTLTASRHIPVVFVFRAGLGFASPPAKPPALPTFGSYCFKATCDVSDQLGCPIAKVTGYDTDLEVAKHTEYMCNTYVKSREMRGRGLKCGEAAVVMLPNVDKMECKGEMFFTMDGTTKRLL